MLKPFMHRFRITIWPFSAGEWPVVAEHFPPTGHAVSVPGAFRLNQTELLTQVTPRDYGLVLGRGLFREQILELFVSALATSGGRLHVQLLIEDRQLRSIKWQRLCGRVNLEWRVLAADPRCPCSLYLPSHTNRVYPRLNRSDLRALIVVASPPRENNYRLPDFNVPAAIAGVTTTLGTIPCEVLGTETTPPATLKAIVTALTQGRFPILYVVAHGSHTRNQSEAVLYLHGEDRAVEPVTSSRWLDQLGSIHPDRLPRLAYFSVCQSASPEAELAHGGFAQRMVRELGTPAVLAMSESVSVSTANELAAGFFRHFAEHGSVDSALAEAAAPLAERFDISVPALYSRLDGASLFETAVEPSESEKMLASQLATVEERTEQVAAAVIQVRDDFEREREVQRIQREWERRRAELLQKDFKPGQPHQQTKYWVEMTGALLVCLASFVFGVVSSASNQFGFGFTVVPFVIRAF